MITYETDPSPFFAANKTFCEAFENKLKTMNAECKGFCNSYGYEIESDFKKDNLNYSIKCQKYHNTQNGVMIPVDSHEYRGVEINITGLNDVFAVSAGHSAYQRMFISDAMRGNIPSPYFLKFNYSPEKAMESALIKTITNHKVSKLKLYKGKLTCKINMTSTDPADVLADIEKVIATWK